MFDNTTVKEKIALKGGDRLHPHNKNWNMFAGDIEYKTNFFLQFETRYTHLHFQNDKFQRNRLLIKLAIILSVFFCIIMHFFNSGNKQYFLIIGIFFHVFCLHLIKKKSHLPYLRLCFIIIQCSLLLNLSEHTDGVVYHYSTFTFNIISSVLGIL